MQMTTAKKTVKLALIQMLVEGGRKERNLQRAGQWVQQAAGQGAAVVVLPEAMTLGWTDPSALNAADAIPDSAACAALRSMARANRVYLVAGLVERAHPHVYNAAILVDPSGEILLHYRKTYELEIGHPFYALGDRLQVARTPMGTFGLMICADAFVRGQVISRVLGYMGADVILSPCSWAVPADHDNRRAPYGNLWLDNYGPVARDFRLWIVGVSNVGWITGGPWQGRKCIGCSLVVGPSGEKVVMGPYGPKAETMLLVDIQLGPRPAQGEGWERLWSSQSWP
jgi:predicted amidohydrolase